MQIAEDVVATLVERRVVPGAPARHITAVVSPVEKADVLLEALPYIRNFAGKVLVIKYGGHAMDCLLYTSPSPRDS